MAPKNTSDDKSESQVKEDDLQGNTQISGEVTKQVFSFNGLEINPIIKDGEPWFVASEITKALGYSHNPTAVKGLEDYEKGVSIRHTPGGEQKTTTINESGLYSLILKSRRPEAKEFKRLVTETILPSIRKTGAYVDPSAVGAEVAVASATAAAASSAGAQPAKRRRKSGVKAIGNDSQAPLWADRQERKLQDGGWREVNTAEYDRNITLQEVVVKGENVSGANLSEFVGGPAVYASSPSAGYSYGNGCCRGCKDIRHTELPQLRNPNLIKMRVEDLPILAEQLQRTYKRYVRLVDAERKLSGLEGSAEMGAIEC